MGLMNMIMFLPIAGVMYFLAGILLYGAKLPAGWSQKWKTRFYLVLIKALGIPMIVAGKFGYNTLPIGRSTFKKAYPWLFHRKSLDKKVTTRDIDMDGVSVRVYEPRTSHDGARPGLIFITGGGWCFSSIDMADGFVKRLVNDTGTVAISIQYRLAPEDVFPAPFYDCVAATKYFLKNAAEFGVDATRVAIAGDSTGANMATAVCLKLVNEKASIKPKVQALLYPCTQALNFQTPSAQEFKAGPIVTQAGIAFNYAIYAEGHVGNFKNFYMHKHVPKDVVEKYAKYMDMKDLPVDEAKKNWKPVEFQESSEIWNEVKDALLSPYLSPLLAPSLKGMPKTYISIANQDVFRDDGIWYGERLKKEGINVHEDKLDCIHGWTLFSETINTANMATRKLVEYLKEEL